MTTSHFQIFIGYDEREQAAYDVCKFSIEEALPFYFTPTPINKLYSKDIPEYNRLHNEPQSTDFTYTRFWVPFLSNYQGISLFCDCDFLFLEHPEELVANYFDPKYAVQVVKHPSYIPRTQVKMDGKTQHRSYRKNWCSLMLFNNEHPKNKLFGPDLLNAHAPGLDFHHLSFYNEDEIGSLPLEWNCLDDYYLLENPKAIHYTDGGPWFQGYENTTYSNLWSEKFLKMKNDMAGKKKTLRPSEITPNYTRPENNYPATKKGG